MEKNITRQRFVGAYARLSIIAVLSGVALVACGDDPVAYSETVSVKLSGIKPGDIQNGQASEDKNINTEEGNPYGDFVKHARDKLGGRDPGAIEIVSAIVRVHADSKNVSTIDAVFTSLELLMADSATTIAFGTKASPTGSEVAVAIKDDLDYEPVFDSMLGGDFKVGVRGPTVATPPTDFELKLTLDLKFTAYE